MGALIIIVMQLFIWLFQVLLYTKRHNITYFYTSDLNIFWCMYEAKPSLIVPCFVETLQKNMLFIHCTLLWPFRCIILFVFGHGQKKPNHFLWRLLEMMTGGLVLFPHKRHFDVIFSLPKAKLQTEIVLRLMIPPQCNYHQFLIL